ncbi:MAG: fluoride efflux transporter CrcB [Bacteroidota bacterium]
MSYLYVFLGGGVGSVCRYGLAVWLNDAAVPFPWGTLAANVLSCLVLGCGMALLSKAIIGPDLRLLVLVGFCGGFSTFSTFSNELLTLLRQAQYGVSLLYFTVSMLAGLLAIMLGMRLLG